MFFIVSHPQRKEWSQCIASRETLRDIITTLEVGDSVQAIREDEPLPDMASEPAGWFEGLSKHGTMPAEFIDTTYRMLVTNPGRWVWGPQP